jgi:hypothetical protein
LDFNDYWQDSYDDEDVDAIKQDLYDNGGTILYEVQAFYDLIYGRNGTLTQFYAAGGPGQQPDPEFEIARGYQDYMRYLFAANDNVYTISTLQRLYLQIVDKAAELINDDTGDDVETPNASEVWQ